MHKTFPALIVSAMAVCAGTPSQADETPMMVVETVQTHPVDFVDAFGTRIYPNDSPCTPANAPEATPNMDGHYIGVFPGGDEARSWALSVRLDVTRSVFTLGAQRLPLVYGVTDDGKHLVRTHGMPLDDAGNEFVFQGLFPIWAAVVENKWACYYLPGYNYPASK